MLGSFKHRLALYFVLLAVVPLAAAFWAFGDMAKRAEERKVDARIGAELRAVVGSYERRASGLSATARRLARRPAVQQALRDGRLSALPPGVRVAGRRRLVLGPRASLSAARTVRVRAGGHTIGSITAELPLDRAFLRALAADGGLAGGDRIVFVPRTRAFASSRAMTVSVSNERYRAFATAPLAEQPRVQLAVLAPARAIDGDAGALRRHLFYVLLGALLVIGCVAAGEGRIIMRSVGELASAVEAVGRGRLDRRVPVRGRDEFAAVARSFNAMADQLRARLVELDLEKTRLRSSIDRTGELLTATHDARHLLALIASAAVEAADAEGAVLLGENGDVIEIGTVDDDAARVELPLATADSRFGILILYAAGRDDLAPTRALVAQAAVALENAKLHEIVEQRAISDGLTGLANRAHCQEQLAAEVARSQRYENPLTVILADVDNFKAANDTYGHAFGDLALQQFAAVLGDTVRDVDVSGRWGGEEFLVVLPGTSLDGGLEAAERIRTAFASLDFAAEGDGSRMTASFGVATFAEGMTPEALVQAADAALYEAKRSGKNRVEAAASEPSLRA